MTVPTICGIDPGTDMSGWVWLQGDRITGCGIEDNAIVLARIRGLPPGTSVVIERVEPRYGLPMGWETIATIEWVGRFAEAAPGPVAMVTRSDTLRHLGIPAKANADSGVRAAMLDRWGGQDAGRKGGELAALRKHMWQALGVAVAYREGCRSSWVRRDVR